MSLVTFSTANDLDDNSNGDQLPCVVEEINFPPLPKEEEKNFLQRMVTTHCNGIICLSEGGLIRKHTIVLCNPSVVEFKIIHTPCLQPDSRPSGCGFGYDPKTDDYKYAELYLSNKAMVYSLRNNSWKEIEANLKNNRCYTDTQPHGVYCKGVYYWWNVGAEGCDFVVLSFDMMEEEFRTILLPNHVHEETKIRELTLWNGSVAFFFALENSWHSTTFEMWVMVHNFGGVEGFTFWTKHLTIEPLVCIYFPLTFWKSDELLMETRDGRIVSYNLNTQKFRQVSVPGPVIPGTTYADLCFQSLVSVKREVLKLNR